MHTSSRQDLFGRSVAARLSQASDALGHDISERLRVARQQAVMHHKALQQAAFAEGRISAGAGTAALHMGGSEPGLWARLASALPVLVLIAGLAAIHLVQNEDRANEVAEIDTALLTDALPTAAYTDPGFIQFLKTGAAAPDEE